MADSFDLDMPAPAAAAPTATPYRVLARKYRPQSFDALIGQDAMVQTLGNAIRRDRLAHAFLLTGVRGVGKTSTARLIAKALNCIGPDGAGGPTIDPCGVCEPCRAIAEGRHIDVVEMDAASHTGVDDVREIIEAVRYAAVSARYKIYIVDEVHMLSRNAFNALLKTLEEPPAHVKFLFATTEVNKVPVTVLSRCQRFDLRRIPADLLADHFARVVAAEGVSAEPEALALIARAAEGSARDGLSILDQAIAHAGTDADGVTAGQVRDMLGLSDRGAVRRLLALVLAGDPPAVLAALADQHALGVEPASLFRGLLETVHGITRAKAGGAIDPAQSAEERTALGDWGEKLGHATLHRLWQLLLKGLAEVESTAMPIEAAEMALLRIVHAGQMPDPGELLRRIEAGEIAAPSAAAPASPAPPPAPRAPASFADLLDLAKATDFALCVRLEELRVADYDPPRLAIVPVRLTDAAAFAKAAATLATDLRRLTGTPWTIELGEKGDARSVREQEEDSAAARRRARHETPVVAAAFAAFPDARIVN